MKALIQRVTSASVAVDGQEIARIGQGLLVFVGVAEGDTAKDATYLVDKTIGLRIFADDSGKFNLSALDISAELLIVSQFTLMANTKKGRRPSFASAAPPEMAEKLFNEFVSLAESSGLKVATGQFQKHMEVALVNDGPVTIMLDSKDKIN